MMDHTIPAGAGTPAPADLTPRIRALALLGVVAPIVFAVVIVVAGFLFPGYSHVSQAISELGGAGAEVPIVQSLNFIFLGVSLLGFAWALDRATGGGSRGPKLIAFFAVSSAIANGLLPCDVGCRGATTVGLLHNLTGVAGFVAAIAGMILLARHWGRDPAWQAHARFTWVMVLIAIAGLGTFIGMKATGSESTDGVAQRVFVAGLLCWICATGLRIRRQAGGSRVA